MGRFGAVAILPARSSLLSELLGGPGIRLSFLQGALEIVSPSPRHEFLKKQIARLLEVFSLERAVPLIGYGSTTFRREEGERGLEPDECYCIGQELHEVPDVAIDVILTSGGLDKLEIYGGLGVREVWFWRADQFDIHVLEGDWYRAASRSGLVPSIDFVELADFVRRPDQYAAALAFRELLRWRRGTLSSGDRGAVLEVHPLRHERRGR